MTACLLLCASQCHRWPQVMLANSDYQHDQLPHCLMLVPPTDLDAPPRLL